MTLARRYWDSDCFLGWFLAEPDKVEKCRGVVQAAQTGEVEIVTSALTLVEVIKLKGHASLPAQREETIRSFFENPFILLRNLDRPVGEYARRLIWEHSFLKPKDAVHVATALLSAVPVLDTFDADLLRLDGRLGDPPLRIGHPQGTVQTSLPFPPPTSEALEPTLSHRSASSRMSGRSSTTRSGRMPIRSRSKTAWWSLQRARPFETSVTAPSTRGRPARPGRATPAYCRCAGAVRRAPSCRTRPGTCAGAWRPRAAGVRRP